MAIVKDVLDQLVGGRNTKDVFDRDALVDELEKGAVGTDIEHRTFPIVPSGRPEILELF